MFYLSYSSFASFRQRACPFIFDGLFRAVEMPMACGSRLAKDGGGALVGQGGKGRTWACRLEP